MKENDKKEYKNWYKTLKRIQKKELILFVVLILLALIFVGISETAYEWFKIIKIYSVLDDNPLINIPICIIISGFAIWWWTKIWKDKDIRPYRLGIIVFGLIVFIFIDEFQYANIVCNFSYQWFFIGLFSLLFIVSLIKIFATCEITWAQNLIDWTFKIFKKLIARIKIIWENKGKIKDKENNNTTESNGGSVDNTEIKDSKENKEPELKGFSLIEWKFKIFKKLIVRIEIFWKNKGKIKDEENDKEPELKVGSVDNTEIKDKKNDNKTELKGFSVDDTEIELEDNQIKYAETLVKKLKNTDLSKESFAVGITGEWGSGKSTFLNTMKEKIKEAKFAEIIEFNPWLCNSPEQVTQDFFATLINELSPKHSTLSRDINKYAKLLNKIAKPSLSIFGIDLDLTPGDDSLDELKENISKKLANLPKKVVILIDDTDRLEGNEVFEILRLIRNTADFRNVIYIATYDKEYVTNVLEGNKIKDPSAYLEKIFQIEVHLPKVESYKLGYMLIDELKIQTLKQDIINFNITNIIFSKDYHKFIFQILGSYRQVKRFARQFAAYLDYLYKNNLINEFSIIDLFWIELLQVYDKRIYNILAKAPDSILVNRNQRYTIQAEITPKDWKEKTKAILEIIFNKEYDGNKLFYYQKDIDKRRLRLEENYEKYFALNLDPRKVSFKEMHNMLIDTQPEKYIDKWLSIGKDIKSIFFQLYQFEINNITKSHLNNYIIAILYTALKNKDIWDYNVDALLDTNNYSNYEQEASDIATKWFSEKINNTNDERELGLLSSLLNKLHQERAEEINYTLIISDQNIEGHLKSIITKVLEKNNYSALAILQPRHELNVIFKNCCVRIFNKNDEDRFEQIAFDIVIDHFSKKANKPTIEKFDKVYKEDYEFENMTDDDITILDTELTELFGTSYKRNKEKFKKECFIQN